MIKNGFFIAFISFCFTTGYAQKNENTQLEKPLKELIIELEKQYDVRFSYDSSLIESFSCTPFLAEKSLSEKLTSLSRQTNLLFEIISKRYIVVKKKKATKNHKICGFIINKKTKDPIVFASVLLNKTQKGTITDSNGYFELKNISSNQIILLHFLGYQTKKIPAFSFFNSGCLTIFLEEDNVELEEVLISDYLTQGISKKNNGAIQVSPRKLGILPGLTEPDVLLSLQLLPGVQSPGENASGLYIRGGSPDQNLVLFDGIKMYQSGHFFGLISSFNPYVTQKISFFRGGTSAKYGDRIGGVLDISSGDDIPEFQTGFGINMTHADAYIKTPLFNNKVGFVFSARRSITDFVKTITYQKFSESVFQNTKILEGLIDEPNRLSDVNNNFYFKDYNLKIIASITNKDKITLSNLFNKNELNYAAKNQKFREVVEDDIAIENSGNRINWNRIWNSSWSQNLDFHSSEYQLNYFGKRNRTRNNMNDNSEENFTVQNHVNDFGLNYNLSYNISGNTSFSGGYQYSNNSIFYRFENSFAQPNNKLLNKQNTANNTHALYAEYKYLKDKNLHLIFGLRTNYFSSVEQWYIEPRFFLLNKVSDQISIKFSGEIKNQAVSQILEYRNNGIGLENNIWAIANNEIPVLESQQITGGILFRKNGWNLDVDLYFKKIKGLTLMTDNIINGNLLYVSGDSDTKGMDFLLKKRFGNYRSWISYTLSNTNYKYKQLNLNEAFSGTYDIPHSLVWSHTYVLNRFEFSLGLKVRSGIPYTKALGTELDNNNRKRIVYGKINNQRVPRYQRIDFSSTYKFKFSKKSKTQGKIGVSFINMLNTKNILDRKYELKVVNSLGGIEEEKLIETDKISIGFTPNIVFRVTF